MKNVNLAMKWAFFEQYNVPKRLQIQDKYWAKKIEDFKWTELYGEVRLKV